MKNLTISLFIILVHFTGLNGQVEVDSGFVDIKNGKLFYKTYGKGDPIVFLNGGPNIPCKYYKAYADSLSKTHKVILFDHRGTGQSICPKDKGKIRMSRMINDLDALRKHLSYDRWIVFGHSFGGTYAMYYASEYPEYVTKLILSSTPQLENRSKTTFQEFKIPPNEKLSIPELQLLVRIKEQMESSEPNTKLLRKLKGARTARFYVHNPNNYEKVINWSIGIEKAKDFYMYSDLKVQETESKLKKFYKPVLIIHGLSDFINLASPLHNSKLFPDCQLELIEHGGHILTLDKPKLYWQHINDFL